MSVRVPWSVLVLMAVVVSVGLGVSCSARSDAEGQNHANQVEPSPASVTTQTPSSGDVCARHAGLGKVILFDLPEPTAPVPTTLVEAWDIALREGRTWSPGAEIVAFGSVDTVISVDRGPEGEKGRRTAWQARLFDTRCPTETLVVKVSNGKSVYAAIEPGGPVDVRAMARPKVDSSEALVKAREIVPGFGAVSTKAGMNGYAFALRNDSNRLLLDVVGSTHGSGPGSMSFDGTTGALVSGKIYAPSPDFGGVLYSKDGGKTWFGSNLRGMVRAPTATVRGDAFAVRVNVTTLELWRSTDGGKSWTKVRDLPAEMGSWAYTATVTDVPNQGHTMLLSTLTGLWASRDEGLTWVRNDSISAGTPQYFTAVSNTAGTSIIASVVDGPGTGKTYISSDLVTWQVLFDGLRHFYPSTDGSSVLATDPLSPTLKADVIGKSAVSELAVPISVERAAGEFDPPGRLLVRNGNQLAVSSNGGKDWQVVGGRNYIELALSPAFAGDGVALASVFRGGLERSEDFGLTWRSAVDSPRSVFDRGGDTMYRIVFLSPTDVFAVSGGALIWMNEQALVSASGSRD